MFDCEGSVTGDTWKVLSTPLSLVEDFLSRIPRPIPHNLLIGLPSTTSLGNVDIN